MNLWTIDGDKLRLRLHQGQKRAWRSRRRFTFMLAGTQGGKTSFGPWWLWREIYGGAGVDGRGAGDYLAVTASFDLFKLKMLPEIRRVFEDILGLGRWWSGDKVLELRESRDRQFLASRADDPMWGRIILRSAHAEGGLEAATAKGAWLDECGQDTFRLAAWEAVLRRLSLNQGRVLGTTTPYNLGWLKSQVYDPWRAGDKEFEVVQFRSTANPAFPAAEFRRAQRTLAAWKFLMFYCGLFDRPAGLVYDVFDEDVHVIDPVPIPAHWPRVVGVDPIGAVTCALWLAWDEANKKLHVYREYYEGYGKTTEEHVKSVLKAGGGEPIVVYVGGGPSERQARLDWSAAGIPLQPPSVTAVESQIDKVYGLFKEYQIAIHRNVKHLIDDLGTMARKLDSNDQPTEKIENITIYHAADALRYIVSWLTTPNRAPQSRVVYQPFTIGGR